MTVFVLSQATRVRTGLELHLALELALATCLPQISLLHLVLAQTQVGLVALEGREDCRRLQIQICHKTSM